MAREVQAPISIIPTDANGSLTAATATTPPTSGVDGGLRVYANLGAAVVPVSQTLSGAPSHAEVQVSISTGATLILAARATRRSIVIYNPDASLTLYVGASNVTSATGMAVAPKAAISIPSTAAFYGITASGTINPVSAMEVYD